MSVVRTDWPRLALLGAAALGAGMSALLLYDYVTPTPHVCEPGGGCDIVRRSAFAYVSGVPLPVFGIAFFGGLLALGLWMTDRARRLLTVASAASILSGVVFIALQALIIGAFCQLCLVVDVSAIAAGAAGIVAARRDASGSPGLAGGLLISLGFLAPIAIGFVVASPPPAGVTVADGALPEPIAREQRPGVATIVEFMDFQCPYCREQHQTMKAALAQYGDRVHIVYKHVPLPGHPQARPAARAFLCAAEQGRGPAMADRLFAADPLDAGAIARAAEQSAVDLARFDACLASERPDEIIETDLADAEAAAVRGLPTFYVGDLRMEGLQDLGTVRAGIERALHD